MKKLIKIIIDFWESFSIKRNEKRIKVFAFKIEEGLGLCFIELPFLLIFFIFFRFGTIILRKINPMVLILSIKINMINSIDSLILRTF